MKDKLLQSQQGNVLVYALLTIAAILSSSIVISNIITGSVVHTGLIVSAQSAFYNAESGVEKSLFEIRKKDILPNNGDCNLLGAECKIEISDDGVDLLVLDLDKNQSVQIDLFDSANNINGSGVESFTMEWNNPQTWIELSVVEWPSDFVFEWPNLQASVDLDTLPAKKFLYSGGQELNTAINNYLIKTNNYRLRVKALYGNADNLTLKIHPTEDGGGAMAFPNYLTIESVGKSRDSSHQLSVEMPRYSPLMGLFDYVLFSESVIEK